MSISIWRDSKISKIEEFLPKNNNSKTLVYYASVGEKYSLLTNLSIKTLLTNGEYKGDILVFGDRYYKNIFGNRVKKVKIYGFDFENSSEAKYSFYVDKIKTEDYEQILYLDSDIEITSDISSLFFYSKGKLTYAIEHWHKHCNLPFNVYYASHNWTKEDYIKYGDKNLVNCGCFCIDAKLFKQFIAEWRTIASITPVFGSDQSSFNLIVFRELFDSKPFEKGVVDFNSTLATVPIELNYKNNILNHYIGKDKSVMINKLS